MTRKLALVTGVGPGTGAAIARRFGAGGYDVAMIARDAPRLAALEAEIPGAKGFVCDVADEAALLATLDAVEASMGAPTVVVHNAVGGAWGNFAEIDAATLSRNFQINTVALLHLAQRLTPAMVAAGEGALMVTGNPSALRGRSFFAGFAPTKAAQRILSEAIARELGPKGVHVAYFVIDAVISVPWTRERFADKPDEFFIQPAHIAEEIWHVAHQPRSSWSFLVELRPHGEVW